MSLAERIYQEAQRLPEPLNREVLALGLPVGASDGRRQAEAEQQQG